MIPAINISPFYSRIKFLFTEFTDLNNFVLPDKLYYTTQNICKVLNIYPDTFRYKLKAAYYLEPGKVGGKRRFSEQDIRKIIQLAQRK